MAARQENEKVDVLVVGAGASGSILAAKLAQAGKRVLVLESGPARTMGDLISSQIWARRIHGGEPSVATGGTDPIAINFNAGWGTGGAALHHYAVWLRLHPEDFEVKSRFGVGLDWPISYDDLRPYYDRVQEEVGISGDADAEVWRPAGAPYPMPPLQEFAQARLIKKGWEATGFQVAPTPLAITSQEYKGRPACIYDGWCSAGCPIGALANPLVVYLPQATAAGATIRNDAHVVRVLTTADGGRATGVEYVDGEGTTRVQEADVVVLAAFAIENPRILLTSATDKHPDGLCNRSGTVGKYLTSHAIGLVNALFAEETENHLGVSGGQVMTQDGYPKDPATKGHVGSHYWGGGPALKPNDLLGIANARVDLFGSDLHAFLEQATKHLALLFCFVENLPDPDNRVTLSDQKDARGIPLANATHAFGEDALKEYEAALPLGQEALKAAGATEVWPGNRGTVHIMGGTIMGADAASSVANGYGQTHEVPNLFLAGSGLFPTVGAVNPTFTIHALALRTAEYLVDNWSGLV